MLTAEIEAIVAWKLKLSFPRFVMIPSGMLPLALRAVMVAWGFVLVAVTVLKAPQASHASNLTPLATQPGAQ